MKLPAPVFAGLVRAATVIRSLVKATMKPRPIERIWQWIDKHVSIPMIVGSTNPGPLDTNLVPPIRGLYDLFWLPRVHLFTWAKSARVGGTLFCICCVLHKIATWPGPILWVDPTRKTALRFSRGEFQPHIFECPPVLDLAVISKTTWTTLEMMFKACTLGMVGAGSAADLGGRQAEMLVLNERDKFKQDLKAEAPPAELAKARTKQFRHTRKVLSNSTPTIDTADHWQDFLSGSQHYCYVPCPHCSAPKRRSRKARRQAKQRKPFVPPSQDQCEPGRSPLSYDPQLRGWQRFTFFQEKKDVPFDEHGRPLPEGKFRSESTGRYEFSHCKRAGRDDYDLQRVETETAYTCGHCGKRIEHSDLNWMIRRYWWRGHNPKAPRDHISAHFWAAYSPFEHWGQTAKKFLLARGSTAKMHDLFNADFGLPFVRHATTIKEDDIDAVIRRSPEYGMRELPRCPLMLTMCVDVQGFGFWWSIKAWGIDFLHPDWPTWCAIIDCGPAVTWEQIEEIAGLKAQDDGTWNTYSFEGEEFSVTAGLIDSGFEAQKGKDVYAFCRKHADVFSPSKGGGRQHLRGKFVTESLVGEEELGLIWYWDDHFKQQLYYEHIKEGKTQWWAPRDLPQDYKSQLCAERTIEEKQSNGTFVLKWIVEGAQGNHGGDVEKMHEVLREAVIETVFEAEREKRRAIEEKVSAVLDRETA